MSLCHYLRSIADILEFYKKSWNLFQNRDRVEFQTIHLYPFPTLLSRIIGTVSQEDNFNYRLQAEGQCYQGGRYTNAYLRQPTLDARESACSHKPRPLIGCGLPGEVRRK